MFDSISHASIYVTDQEKALDFYVGKLGLEVRADVDMEVMRWLTLGVPGQDDFQILIETPIESFVGAESVDQIEGLLSKGALGLGFILNTDDCRKTFAELVEKGVEVIEEPTDRFYGIDCGIRDPFGNHIRITEPVARRLGRAELGAVRTEPGANIVAGVSDPPAGGNTCHPVQSTAPTGRFRLRRITPEYRPVLLRPRLPLRLPVAPSGSAGSSPTPSCRSRSGSRSCSAACSRASTAGRGPRRQPARRGCARSSGGHRRRPCSRSAGPTRGPATCSTRCGSRPTRSRSGGRSRSRSRPSARRSPAAAISSVPDNVAIAAAACELHPNAIAKAAASESVKRKLREETDRAGDRGVFGVPSVAVGDEVFWGDDRLEDALAAAARAA